MEVSSESVFRRFVPAAAVDYCDRLYRSLGFEFKVKKTRRSKQGDYRYDPRSKKHTITINNDLNSYSFLITYIHEVAHLVTFKEHGRAVAPHGNEWKTNFKRGLDPVMTAEVFPPDVLKALQRHLQRPKAASCSDPALYGVLRAYDPRSNGEVILREISDGEHFIFHDQEYLKLHVRRTRALCKQVKTGRRYLISQIATVLKISP